MVGSWVHRDEKLRPFQRAFIRGATAPGIDTAALSTPRGSGSLRHPTICSGRARSRFFVPGLWSRRGSCFASSGQR